LVVQVRAIVTASPRSVVESPYPPTTGQRSATTATRTTIGGTMRSDRLRMNLPSRIVPLRRCSASRRLVMSDPESA
jgi:hypothetical protein